LDSFVITTMDGIPKQEYRLRDLPTRSVTLFPSRAQVVRDIKDLPLKVSTHYDPSSITALADMKKTAWRKPDHYSRTVTHG